MKSCGMMVLTIGSGHADWVNHLSIQHGKCDPHEQANLKLQINDKFKIVFVFSGNMVKEILAAGFSEMLSLIDLPFTVLSEH